MSSPFVAEITIFAFNFAPTGWALCAGQLLPISQNTALFSLLGTMYGGDGQTTFALPDLQGRGPLHQCIDTGLGTFTIGQAGGTLTEKLTTAQVPSHTHKVKTTDQLGDHPTPKNHYIGQDSGSGFSTSHDTSTLASDAESKVGDGQSHNNMQPYLSVTFGIPV